MRPTQQQLVDTLTTMEELRGREKRGEKLTGSQTIDLNKAEGFWNTKIAPAYSHPSTRSIGVDGVISHMRETDDGHRQNRSGGRPVSFPDDARFQVVDDAEAEYRGDPGIGEFFRDVAAAGTPSSPIPDKLQRYQQRAASGMSEGSLSDGGFLVTQSFSNKLLEQAAKNHPLLSMVTKIPISSGANGIVMPAEDEDSRATGSRHGGVRGYWVAEAGSITSSKPKFRQVSLTLKKLAALVYTTDELLQDAAALAAYLRRVGPDELGWLTQNAVVNGLGNTQPLGFMNSGCLVTASKQSGQAAATFLYENALNMWTRMAARNRANAVWLINQDVEPELYQMHMTIGTAGAPVFLPSSTGASGQPYSTLFGRPIIPIEQCATLGTTGDVVLCDPSAYLLADKKIKADSSIHVRFQYDESVFRFIYRVDGCPELDNAITPANGTNTLSPFVALESRD